MENLCCPPFDPAAWDEKVIHWENKLFLKDRVVSLLHIPLNFGSVMKRNIRLIEAVEALPGTRIILSDENSLWGADVYIEVSKNIPQARMSAISGTFLSKVFEGPYKNIRTWIAQINQFTTERGCDVSGLFFYYTTCPKCARKYGKNYVVLLARISGGKK